MRPSSRNPTDLVTTLTSVLDHTPDAPAIVGALARTIRANRPQTRDHPSHEVLIDDWAHGYALGQNRRPNHAVKQTVLNVARRIDDAGLGRLMLGRRGKRTRFSLPPQELSAWLEAFDSLAGSGDHRNGDPEEPPPATTRPPERHVAPAGPAPRTAPAERSPPAASAPERRKSAPVEAPARPPPVDGRLVDPNPSEDSAPKGAPRIAHRFVLRPGVDVVLELPADFTANEARRLARFVSSLPFDDEP